MTQLDFRAPLQAWRLQLNSSGPTSVRRVPVRFQTAALGNPLSDENISMRAGTTGAGSRGTRRLRGQKAAGGERKSDCKDSRE